MKTAFLTILLFIASQCMAQKGIQFNNISWNEATVKAASENKLIFIDCYTTWCGPCKWMDQFVFPLDSVADFYNSHFINFKSDMEKGEGIDLKKKYAVRSYPTYLFVNDKGDVVHRSGSRMEAREFMFEGRSAIDPNNSFAGLQKRYDAGERSTDLLFRYASAVRRTNVTLSNKIAADMVAAVSEKELLSSQGWEIIKNYTKQEDDKLALFLQAHQAFFIKTAGEEPVKKLNEKLGMLTMFALTREKNEKEFFRRLSFYKQNSDSSFRITGALLESDFHLTTGNAAAFVKSSNEAMHSTLKYSAVELSFLANKARNKAMGNSDVLAQAYLLAKRAADLRPNQYAFQSTLAEVCIAQGNKDNALNAASNASKLAIKENSKIQELARNLVKKAQEM